METMFKTHDRLLDILRTFPESRLDDPAGKSGCTHAEVIRGVVAHTTHHGGEIQMIRIMYRTKHAQTS